MSGRFVMSSPGHSWQNLRYARDDSGYDYHKFNTTGPICGLTDIVASYTSVQDVCNGPTAPLSPCTDTNDQCKKGSCLVHVGHVDPDNDPKFACTCHGYDCSTTTTNMSTTLTATSTGTGAGGSQSRTSSAVDTVTPTTQPSYARYHKVNTRAIAGGTIGGMIFLALVIILFWFLRQRRHRAPASAEFLEMGLGRGTPTPTLEKIPLREDGRPVSRVLDSLPEYAAGPARAFSPSDEKGPMPTEPDGGYGVGTGTAE